MLPYRLAAVALVLVTCPVALPERATMRQALSELSNRTGVVIRADDGFAHAGIDNDLRVTARFRNVTLQTALGVVLSQTLKLPSLNYNVVNDEVVISALPKPATD